MTTVTTVTTVTTTAIAGPEGSPLQSAWQAVRRARQTAWGAGNGTSWACLVAGEIRQALAHLVRHAHAIEGAAPATSGLPGRPGGHLELERFVEEHRELTGCMLRILAVLEQCDCEQVEDLIRISEATIMVEMRLAMHLNRQRSLQAVAVAPLGVERELNRGGSGLSPRHVRTSAGLTGLRYDDLGIASSATRRRYALGGD